MIVKKTTGLIAAPYTPFDKQGKVNLSLIKEYSEFLKNQGLAGAFVNGSTGETSSLTLDEKLNIAEEWIKYQDDGFKIFLHAGSNSIEEAKILASQAESLEAYAFAATGPSYFKPSTVDDLLSFMTEIASSAPKTAYYYYHIPALNQNYLSITDFLEKAVDRIPNLSGMKYTNEDLMEFQLCRQIADGKLDILYGRDETLICGLVLGAVGGVGSTYNFMPKLYMQIIENFNLGNLEEANRLQVRSMRIIQQYGKYKGVPAGKVIMKSLGIDLGNPRLPFRPLSNSEESDLMTALKELGLFI